MDDFPPKSKPCKVIEKYNSDKFDFFLIRLFQEMAGCLLENSLNRYNNICDVIEARNNKKLLNVEDSSHQG